ncbi:MAG: hypothetical protein KAH57_10125 [Thermoplasmata archaeon]|nr:hypothetical protein [Thermoplasmata archaeon]
MEEIEKAKQAALEKLRAIQTIEDVKEHEQEIVDTMVGFLTGAVEILRTWFQDILTLEPAEKQMEIVKFQNDNFLADDEVDMELNRISEIPGAEELLDPFLGQLEERLGPVMEETGEIMEKLMSELGGAMMGGLEGAFGAQEEEKEEEEVFIKKGRSFRGEGVKFYQLTKINEIEDMGSFNYYKDQIDYLVEDRVNSDLEQLRTYKIFMVEDGAPLENFKDDIDMAEKKNQLLVEGIKTEMERIATIPKAAEEALKMRDDILEKIKPAIDEMDALIKELRSK